MEFFFFFFRNWLRSGLVLGIGLACAAFAARNLIFGNPVPVYVAVRSDLTQQSSRAARSSHRDGSPLPPRGRGVWCAFLSRKVSASAAARCSSSRISWTTGRGCAGTRGRRSSGSESAPAERSLALPAAEQSARQAEANVRQAQQQYRRRKRTDLVTKNFVAQAQLRRRPAQSRRCREPIAGGAAPGGIESANRWRLWRSRRRRSTRPRRPCSRRRRGWSRRSSVRLRMAP